MILLNIWRRKKKLKIEKNENIDEYNPNKECKTLIVLDDITAGMLSMKTFQQKVTELFTWGTKLNFLLYLLHSLILL